MGFKRNGDILPPRLAKLARCAVHTVEPLRWTHYGSVSVPGFCGDFAALESLRFHCDQENERIFSRSRYCLGVIVKVAQFLAAFCS